MSADAEHASAVCARFGVARAADVRFAHAVNSLTQLRAVTATSPTVHFLECDIQWARDCAVMAHDEGSDGDDFAKWLNTALAHSTLGLKLDFKHPSTVHPALTDLVTLRPAPSSESLDVLLWLNADILRGPGGGEPKFCAETFITTCLSLAPSSVLSLGWTTGPVTSRNDSGYTDAHIDEMIALCDRLQLVNVTFPVRAALVPQSLTQLTRLLNPRREWTLTVWDAVSDVRALGPEETARIVSSILTTLPLDRCFIDCAYSQPQPSPE